MDVWELETDTSFLSSQLRSLLASVLGVQADWHGRRMRARGISPRKAPFAFEVT